MRDFISPKWTDTLRRNRLDSFEQLWALDTGWVEEPNMRRGGWSGVMRHQLKQANGDITPVFIKRQSNHVYRSWQHPFRGEPTFAREMYNILRFKSKGIPVLEPVFFAMRKIHGEQRAILVTEELTGYFPLEVLQQRWQQASGQSGKRLKLELIRQLAPLVRG
ncbi:MAG: lipopolysaccharide kinase, partial [Gammaproteobacteria bacterium]|nr:lipopolysaccharide kinase [Gammaproteobacteria bacterium]